MLKLKSRPPLPSRPTRRLGPALGCLLWLSLLSPLAPAHAGQPAPSVALPVYLWGFQSGCERQDASRSHVADFLQKAGVAVHFLNGPADQPLPACPGPAYSGSSGCMDALKSQCQSASGSVVGGLVEKYKGGMRTRLWLYDLGSGRRAVRDDYCQQCDPDLDKALAAQVQLLLADPPWEPALSSQPSYCRSAAAARSPRGGPLFFGLFGAVPGASLDLPLRNQLLGRLTLKRAATGLEPPQWVPERAPPDRIAAGSPGSQVLLIEKSDSGRATLTLWDQASGRLASRALPCAGACLEPLTQAAAELLDTCFAAGCAGLQSADFRPPSACDALSEAVCPALSGGRGGSGGTSSALSPMRATTAMALLGTGLGLAAATSVGLWIGNERVILDTGGPPPNLFNRLFTPAAIATTALTVGLAGLSVPVFLWLDGHRKSATKIDDPAARGLLTCPQASPADPIPVPTTARTSRPRGEE